jgi:rhamnosyltransferase
MKTSVSVVIPTRNAGPEFRQLLERVTAQEGSYHPEIVIVDSGSSDGTPEVARHYGATVIAIPPGTFNHGLTRNLGIEHSHGEICVLLVQDAMPISDHWLEALVGHFDSDPLICGVTTRQVPRPETDIVTRWEVVQHNNCLGTRVKIRSISDWNAFERLPLQDRFFACNFDNVCSAVRRLTWRTHPFRSLPFAEDLEWAVRVLRAGNKIVYEPAAVVMHSHLRSAAYHLRRHYVSAKLVPDILQCPIQSTFATNDKDFFSAVNVLIQESCSFLLLVDQVDQSIDPEEWRRWVRYVEDKSLDHAGGAGSAKHSACSYARQIGRWLPLPQRFRSILPWSDNRQNPMRAHFFFLMSEIVQELPGLDAAALRHMIVHCLGRSLGHFLGGYYLWAAHRCQVSPELRDIDHCLGVGV